MSETDFKVSSKYISKDDFLIINISPITDRGKEVKLNENFNLVFNKEGIPLFLEVSNASKILNANKISLRNIRNINILIDVSEETISADILIKTNYRNKETENKFFYEIENTKNIPPI